MQRFHGFSHWCPLNFDWECTLISDPEVGVTWKITVIFWVQRHANTTTGYHVNQIMISKSTPYLLATVRVTQKQLISKHNSASLLHTKLPYWQHQASATDNPSSQNYQPSICMKRLMFNWNRPTTGVPLEHF